MCPILFVDGEWWRYDNKRRYRVAHKICPNCQSEIITSHTNKRIRCRPCSKKKGLNPQWKGDGIRRRTGNSRAIRLIPILGKCDLCENKATERHHKDKNPINNEITNIQVLCCKCHHKAHEKPRENGRFVKQTENVYVM